MGRGEEGRLGQTQGLSGLGHSAKLWLWDSGTTSELPLRVPLTPLSLGPCLFSWCVGLKCFEDNMTSSVSWLSRVTVGRLQDISAWPAE